MSALPLAGSGTDGVATGEYLTRIQALLPDVRACADQIEQEGRLPESVLDALVDAGAFRLLLPRTLGGSEVDPVTFVRIIEEIARVDASTAWCVCQNCGCSMISAYLAPAIASKVFGGDPRAVLAWGPGPGARAVAVEGGYRVTGTWSFASGSRHATWLGGYCAVHEADGTPRRDRDGTPIGRTMLFPASAATRVDVWKVIGLRGTGSDTYSVSDLFVPGTLSAARDDPAERHHSGRLYLFPIGSLYAAGFAAVALGIARSALEAFIDLACNKTPRGGKRPLRESPVVQSQTARAEARLRSARLFLLTSLRDIWGAVERGGSLALDQRVLIRLAATHAIHEAKDVVDVVYQAAGATAIFATSAFERRFRDMHAVTQQIQGRLSHFETVGQFVLGLDPDTAFL